MAMAMTMDPRASARERNNSSNSNSNSNSNSSSSRSASVCAMVGSLTTWSTNVFGQCFSKMRRMQFDEEHQRSLLSCHSTDDEVFQLPDDAMMELRRRVQYVEMRTPLRPIVLPKPREADAAVRKLQMIRERRRMQQQRAAAAAAAAVEAQGALHPQRPIQPLTRPLVQALVNDSNQSIGMDGNDPKSPEVEEEEQEEEAEFTVLLSNAEKALSDILNNTASSSASSSPMSQRSRSRRASSLRPEDVQSLSVDELLALDVNNNAASTLSDDASETEAEPAPLTEDAQRLRQWLAQIDPSRPDEYVAYAQNFEKQGFHCQEELAQLDQEDVEQALSEIGVAKFAHRARLRKAIMRLASDGSGSDQSNQ